MAEFFYKVDLKGSEEFLNALSNAPLALKESLMAATQYLRTLVVEKTPWRSGETAGAWSSVEPYDGGFSFGNPLEHILNLEHGYDLAKIKKPKETVLGEGGRYYSKKAPMGIVKPLLDSPEIINGVIAMFLDGVTRRLNA